VNLPALTATGIQIWDSIFDTIQSSEPNTTKAALDLCTAVRQNAASVPRSVFVALQYLLPKCFSSSNEDDESVEDSDSFTGLSQLAISASTASLELVSCIMSLVESDSKMYRFQPEFVDWLSGNVASSWRISALKDVMRVALSDASEQPTDSHRTRLASELLKLLQTHSSAALEIIHGALLASADRRFFFDLGYASLLVKLSTARDQKRAFRHQVVKRLRELVTLGFCRLKVQNSDLLEMLLEIYGSNLSSSNTPSEGPHRSPTRSSRGSSLSTAEIPTISVEIDLDCDDVVSSSNEESDETENL
jgi:hypothetical protein